MQFARPWFSSRSIAQCVLAIAALLASASSLPAASAQGVGSELIPENVALRHGLQRRWVSQVQMDLGRDRLTDVSLSGDALCIQTRVGLAQVIEAESGGARWVAQVGRHNAPSSALTANNKFVALTNDTSLYVLDVVTGKPLFQKQLNGVPFAPPVVDADRVFIPLISGMLMTYSLHKPKEAPLLFHGGGKIIAQPLVTPKSVAWGTTRGFAYVSNRERIKVRYHLVTDDEIVSRLAYRAGVIYVTSRDGYCYAMAEGNGQVLWKFSAGSAIAHEPVVVEDMIFLFPEAGGMFAVSADRGTERWRRPNVAQFLAYRRTDPKYPGLAPCLYAADRSGKTLMLDPATGGLMDTLPTELLTLKLTNTLNDRLYLSTPTGMIQCFHHPAIETPLWLHDAASPDDKKPVHPGRRNPAAGAAAEDDDPAEDAPAEEGAEPDPFDTPVDEGDDPEMEAPADEDPEEN